MLAFLYFNKDDICNRHYRHCKRGVDFFSFLSIYFYEVRVKNYYLILII